MAAGTSMRTNEKIRLLADVIRWRFSWDRRDLDTTPAGLSGKFVTGPEAAARIRDGATVISCGMAGNARCSSFFGRSARPLSVAVVRAI